MKKFRFLYATPALLLPLASVACGQKVDTTAKLKQDEEIKKTAVNTLKNQFARVTLLSLNGINVENSDNLDEQYIKTFQDQNSTLFDQFYKAFQLYAVNKLNSDTYYFAQKILDWTGDRTLSLDEINKFNGANNLKPGQVPSKDQFITLWLNEKTKIREELEKMLFVFKYFEISNQDQLKKVDKNFKYNADLRYALNHYLLTKYAVEKKFAQVWTKDAEPDDDDSFFTKSNPALYKNADDFNKYWSESKQAKPVLKDEIEFISGHNDDKKLFGYRGFKGSSTSYSLKWDYDDLKDKENKHLYGFYDVNNERLVNDEIQKDFTINPIKIDSGDTKNPTLVYVNQIAPIGNAEIDLPKTEGDTKNTSKVKLLSFENTIYKDKLDILSFIFYLNDASLYETAIKAFAEIGYKIKVNKESTSLREAVKDLAFVELV
ncbi:hypothetical protein E1I18_02190 [Mycoplasmopsis mucosicanis]|uniref:P60-like lipoprotein n=1 Tax=Mycoplasmopsis mucosicanis TaxID=458208 RepID=A0A507SN61_9BACT|nr:hypothetical protein [Mycoplasmopsis mucosicanis]TQC51474.1 hypothetical protein E1I18_02190 [Mycoplasmopsis mucosicanis]